MGRFDNLLATIDVNIRENGDNEITGKVLNTTLHDIVEATDAELTTADITPVVFYIQGSTKNIVLNQEQHTVTLLRGGFLLKYKGNLYYFNYNGGDSDIVLSYNGADCPNGAYVLDPAIFQQGKSFFSFDELRGYISYAHKDTANFKNRIILFGGYYGYLVCSGLFADVLRTQQIEQLEEDKQDVLVSSQNIKTVNGQSILGEGNIEIEGVGSYDDTKIKQDIADLQAKDVEIGQELTELSANLDTPIGKGNTEHSAVLKGEYQGYSNKAISQTSVAVGAATTAGLKGWYYSKIDFTNKKITLSDKPTYSLTGLTLIGGSWSSDTPNIKVNDVISLVNNSKYDFCSKVTAVNDNVITVDSLPFTELVKDSGAAAAVLAGQFSDGYSLYIPERPDEGIIDFGGGAFSEGSLSKATNIAAHAEGLQTHAYGQYSHTEGRETKAGYAAHAEGRRTNATGEQSHTEGRGTTASGNCSHAEGEHTTASGGQSHAEGNMTYAIGLRSHAEGHSTNASGTYSHAEGEGKTEGGAVSLLVGAHGRSSHVEGIATTTGEYNEQTEVWGKGDAAHAEGNSTIASGNHSHAEGSGTKASGWQAHSEGHNTLAKGNRSHAEGSGTEALNLGEHAQGSFNKSTESADKSKATQFSIGIGTSATDRKNAVEVKANGDVYIIGIGGYDGTNSDSAQTLQEILANL